MGPTATSMPVTVIMIVVAVIMLHLTRLVLRVMVVLGLVGRLLRVLQTTKENDRLIEANKKSRDWITKYNEIKEEKKNLLLDEKIID